MIGKEMADAMVCGRKPTYWNVSRCPSSSSRMRGLFFCYLESPILLQKLPWDIAQFLPEVKPGVKHWDGAGAKKKYSVNSSFVG